MTLRGSETAAGRICRTLIRRAMPAGFAGVILAALTFGSGPLPQAGVAQAHGYKLGAISIGHVWAPPTGKGAKGAAVFGPILNRGVRTVRLRRASSPIAAKARFRIARNGKVSWPAAIDLPPGKPVGLAPWRVHIWLSGLRKPLAEGQSFDLTLDFGDAGSITVRVQVEKAAGH